MEGNENLNLITQNFFFTFYYFWLYMVGLKNLNFPAKKIFFIQII